MTITSKSPTIANWDFSLWFALLSPLIGILSGVRYGGIWDRLVVDGGMLAQ
jgi:hypothetical protein